MLKLSIKFTFLIFYPKKYIKLHKIADRKKLKIILGW